MSTHLNKTAGLLAAVVLVLTLAPGAASAAAEGDWEYRVDGKNAVVTRYKGADSNPVMPQKLGGKIVTGIAGDAFTGCSILTLTLSAGVRAIEPGAFFECRTVTEFKVEAGNKTFTVDGGVIFRDGGKMLVQYPAGKAGAAYAVPGGVTEIAASAFDHNAALEAITLPDSLTTIGTGAFWRNSALKSIRIPAGVASIGHSVFANCGSLTAIDVAVENKHYKSVGGVLLTKDGRHLVQCPPGLAGHYTVPGGVVRLDEGSFRGDYSLTGVTLADSVESIGACSFAYCEALDTVIAGKALDSVENMAFQGCPMLKSFYFTGNPPAKLGDGIFDGCARNLTLYYQKKMKKEWSKFKLYPAKPYESLPKPSVTPGPTPSPEPSASPAPAATAAPRAPQPQAPGRSTLVSADPLGNGAVRLKWTPAPGASYYEIARSTAYLGIYERIRTSVACTADVPDDEKRYCYRVRAVNLAGETLTNGVWSNVMYASRSIFRLPNRLSFP